MELSNPITRGDNWKYWQKGMEFRIPRRRGRESKPREKGDGTQNHKNKGMEFETSNTKRRTLESLLQVHGTQKAENNVIEQRTPSIRGNNLESQEQGNGVQNPENKGIKHGIIRQRVGIWHLENMMMEYASLRTWGWNWKHWEKGDGTQNKRTRRWNSEPWEKGYVRWNH